MKENKLVYLISTNRSDISILLSRIEKELSHKENVDFVISTQSDGSYNKDSLLDNLAYIRCYKPGLSANRNCALRYFLKNYRNSYAIITDDDVEFHQELTYGQVDRVFSKNLADIVTGKVKIDSRSGYKDYENTEYEHNQRSVNSVSSIEIIIKSDNDYPFFDEEFGLGAMYKMGEEAIFLGDCLKKNLKIFYSPINLFYHPYESTGKIIDDSWYLAKGAFYKRRYGALLGAALLVRRVFQMRSSISMSGIIILAKGYLK